MTIFLKITRESGRVEHDCTHSFNSEEEARGHYDFLMKAGRDGHPEPERARSATWNAAAE